MTFSKTSSFYTPKSLSFKWQHGLRDTYLDPGLFLVMDDVFPPSTVTVEAEFVHQHVHCSEEPRGSFDLLLVAST